MSHVCCLVFYHFTLCLNFGLSFSGIFDVDSSFIPHSRDFGGEKVAADCLYNKELAEALAASCLTAWARGAAVLVADSQVMVVERKLPSLSWYIFQFWYFS